MKKKKNAEKKNLDLNYSINFSGEITCSMHYQHTVRQTRKDLA
jgi:hypothetical protein